MNTDKQSSSAESSAESAAESAAETSAASSVADGPDSLAPLARYFLWTDSQSGVERFLRILVYTCVVLFLIDIVWHRHTKVPGEGFWGFYAIIGFVFFCLLVVASRFLRLFIARDENFYGPYCVDSEEYPEAGTRPLTHAQRTRDTLVSLGNDMLGRDATGNGQGGASS